MERNRPQVTQEDRELFRLEDNEIRHATEGLFYTLEAWGNFRREIKNDKLWQKRRVEVSLVPEQGEGKVTIGLVEITDHIFRTLTNIAYDNLCEMGYKIEADKIIKKAQRRYRRYIRKQDNSGNAT